MPPLRFHGEAWQLYISTVDEVALTLTINKRFRRGLYFSIYIDGAIKYASEHVSRVHKVGGKMNLLKRHGNEIDARLKS